MSDPEGAADAPVALPPNKRRRRESFESDQPEPNLVSTANADTDPRVNADTESSYGTHVNKKSSPTIRDAQNMGLNSDEQRDMEAWRDAGVERRLSGADELTSTIAVHPGDRREPHSIGEDLDSSRVPSDSITRPVAYSKDANVSGPESAIGETQSGHVPDRGSPSAKLPTSHFVVDLEPTMLENPEARDPASALSPHQENGTGQPYANYAGPDDRIGPSDSYDRSREYPDDRPDRLPGSQGPQEHINSVLAPEVASVLNGLFDRGFFEDRDIDARAIDFLASVSPDLALAALEDIQRRDFSTVRNKPAFIFSIFKRVVGSGGAPQPNTVPPGGFPPATVPASALAHLPPQVSDALQRVFASGVCHPSQFDDRAMDILVELHPQDAVRALSEFAAMEPGRVRNPSAFWMGLARKFKSGAMNGAPPRGSGGFPGGGPPGPGIGPGGLGGGRYSPAGGMDPGGYGRQPAVGYSALEKRLEELATMGLLRPEALDERAAEALRKLPEQDALSVLAEIPEPARVRNLSAYVMGLCKKFATGEARSLAAGRGHPGGYGGPGRGVGHSGGSFMGENRELHDALNRMDPDVRGRFYEMVDRGMFPEHAFDHRAIGALESMNVGEACAALDELAASDPRRIHNISAYFMGLARKFGRA